MAINYKQAGVNIDAGNQLVQRIKKITSSSNRPEVIGSLGSFASLFALDTKKYRKPVLVSGTDGVGTKLKLAIKSNHHNTIGIDLVAMCVNDIIVLGAEPLFFLDYFATSKLEVGVAEEVIKGINEGCNMANCALIGGETAEMPGMYKPKDYDLAGFAVGVVEQSKILDGSTIQDNDAIIAIASSGFHSNGYSLINKLIELNNLHETIRNKTYEGESLLQYLLRPTKIYVKSLIALSSVNLKAACHITGGGITENLPRVLPANSVAKIKLNSWALPEPLLWLQDLGKFSDKEMFRTFNCGIGFMVIVNKQEVEKVLASLKKIGELAWEIGEVCLDRATSSSGQTASVQYI